uniref:Uncharacterized protein n=1 Tax=Avena sativa TaxID=4498 RepID=A0ACD5U714_AVESA
MVSSSASPREEEGGGGPSRPTRRGEKRRMHGGTASPEPASADETSQDLVSSKSCEEDGGGTTTTCGKWHPDESHRPDIDDAPVFTPTEEEFEDAIGYIMRIRPQVEKYGVCRVVPPSSWKPPSLLKEKRFWDSAEFNTRVQQVDKLQNREPTKKKAQPRVQKKRKRRKKLRFGIFDGCHDLEKPAGYSKEKDEHNKCVDLNIEDPSSSPRIKEACFSSSTSSALEKLDKDKMVIDCESLGTNNPTTNSQYSQPLHHSSELPCPPRTPAENSTLASIATKKLFGVDIEYGVAKALHAQVCQVAKPSSRQSDQVSRATILKHVVEPLDYGTVMVGKSWCNHQAIFPKGFRSRVTFHNVLDPTRTCCYISEVLDAGLLGPLFRVAVEKLPEISFTHTSPIQCWDSVRDRVNEEIKRQHSAGKSGVPALLSTDSVNGLEMFGFFFPPIIQAIEALDPNHKCLDYWLSKRTPPLKLLPLESMMAATVDGTNNSPIKLLGVDITSKESEQSSFSNNSCSEAVKLGRLLKKAKLPEDSIGSRVDSSSIWSGSRQSAG